MRSVLGIAIAAAVNLGAASGPGQEPVISRSAPMKLQGEVVEISCYKQKGVASGTGAAHVACAKECIAGKKGTLGILSDGDGLFRLWGELAKNGYAKLVPYIGQTVEVTGTEVVLSNNYDVRSFDVERINVKKNK